MYARFTNSSDAVSAYSDLGFALFPCHTLENGVCSCGDRDCGRNTAKHPLTQNGVRDATTIPAKLKEYFAGNYSVANVAVATGEPSGVLVLDVDDVQALEKLETAYGKLPVTPTVETGRGGRHYYFKFDERCRTLKNAVKFAGGLDVRTTGGYVLLPPSVHQSGKKYLWLTTPGDAPFAEAPGWLLNLIPKHCDVDAATRVPRHTVERAKTTLERASIYAANCSPAIAGDNGHATTYRIVCYLVELFGGELDDDELLEALEVWNDRCSPPWSSKELRHKIADARSKITQRIDDSNSEVEVVEDWPMLDDDAFYGLAGEIVKRILPHSECDAASLLTTLLVLFGVAVGRKPYFRIEGTKHHANEFLCVVGKSSKARKGTSFGRIAELFGKLVPKLSGLSTGEGLIYSVRDEETVQIDGKFQTKPGVLDKRKLVYEPEFAKVLKVMRRDTNTLSAVLRDCWDTGTLQVLTKGNPLTATDAHFGVVSHITTDEFRKVGDHSDVFNGFFNRFLWALVRRSQLLPDGGGDVKIDDLRERLEQTIAKASEVEQMYRSDDAKVLWRKAYAELVEEKAGMYDAATSRAEAHVLRLSMIYALLDGQPNIEVDHLKAALAVWRYCDDSARWIFCDSDNAGKLEKRFLEIVRSTPGILRTELRRRISHSTPTGEIDGAIRRLIRQGKIVSVEVVAHGRQAETFYPGALGIRGISSDVPTDVFVPKAPNTLVPTPSQVTTRSLTPLMPECPTSAKSETIIETVQGKIKAATLAELMDFRNLNSLDFVRKVDGSVGLSIDDVPTSMLEAVKANQSTLEAFVPKPMPASSTKAWDCKDEPQETLSDTFRRLSKKQATPELTDAFLDMAKAMEDDDDFLDALRTMV